MKKSVWTLALALVVVLSGIGFAGYAYWTAAQGASAGFPRSVIWLPAGSDVVAHLDVAALSRSPFGQRWLESRSSSSADGEGTSERLEPFQELEERLGIRVLEDIDFVSASASSTVEEHHSRAAEDEDGRRRMRARPDSVCASVAGRFDHARIVDHFRGNLHDASESTVTETEHDGVTLYERRASEADSAGRRWSSITIAFPEDGMLLVGTSECVREMVDAGHDRRASAVDDLVERWGDAAFFGQSFWVSGNPETLGASLDASDVSIPPVSAFALAGRLDHELSLEARGRAADVEAAQQLADVVRGFVALGALQKNSHPELGELAESVVIDQMQTEVLVSVSVPYETIEEALAKRPEADH